jgi:hypothetical protein
VGFGQLRSTTYGTTYRTSGLVLSQTIGNANPAALSTTSTVTNFYTTVFPGLGPRAVNRLDRTESFDGPLGRLRATDYTSWDLTYGVPLTWEERGWSDIGSDNVSFSRTYVSRINSASDDQHRLILPSLESKTRQGTPLGSTKWYYDNRTTHGLPPTKGWLVKTEQERTAGVWINTQLFYDAGYGFVTEERDEAGYSTVLTYEGTHKLYPVQLLPR